MGGKKVYMVEVEWVVKVPVEAADEEEAYANAEYYAEEEMRARATTADHIDVREIESADDLPNGWGDCYPWGGDGKKTMSELLGDSE